MAQRSRSSSTSTTLSHANHDTINEFRDQIKSLPRYQTYDLRIDDQFLIRFLKTAKNNIPKAIKRYNAYYQMLLNLPKSENFTSGTREDRRWVVETLTSIDKDGREKFNVDYPMFGFYGKDQKNRGIIGFDGGVSANFIDYPHFLDACLYGTVLVFDYVLENYDFCQDHGFIMMDDWGKLNLKLFTFYMKNPTFMKNFSALISGTMPIRIGQYYIVNGPRLMTVMYNAVKIFLSEKIKSRIFFASNTKVVKEDIGETELPVFLKGDRTYVFGPADLDIEGQLMKIFPRKRS